MYNETIISEILKKKDITTHLTVIESVEKAISKIRVVGTEIWESGSTYNSTFRNAIKEVESKGKSITPKYFYTMDENGKEWWVHNGL